MIGIYHSKDLDGYCSGAIMRHKYPDIKLIGMDYGQPPFANPNHEEVIICDMSFPMEIMEQISKEANGKLLWIDHHISAINDFNKYCEGKEPFCEAVLDTKHAACELAWLRLFPDKDMPPVVEFLGVYDTWRTDHKVNYWDFVIMPFQYGMRQICSTPETFPMNLFSVYYYIAGGDSSASPINVILRRGEIILDYQKQQNEKACKFCAFETEFEGLRAICLNSGGANSQLFASVYDESKHDIMIPFVFTGKGWTYSLYTTKENIDCSVLAKKYGGGGHKKAAGFKTDKLLFG